MRVLISPALLLCFAAWPALAAAQNASVDPRVLERLMRADANGDQIVTRTEFQGFRLSRFSRMDRNKDGVLSLADKPPLVATSDIEGVLRDFDANKDGAVSRSELARGPTPAFDAADQNQDGRVTRFEAESALARARKGQ